MIVPKQHIWIYPTFPRTCNLDKWSTHISKRHNVIQTDVNLWRDLSGQECKLGWVSWRSLASSACKAQLSVQFWACLLYTEKLNSHSSTFDQQNIYWDPTKYQALCEELYINVFIECSQQPRDDCAHFRDDNLGTKRSEVTCSKSSCRQEAELGFGSSSVSSSNSPYSVLWHPRNSFSFLLQIISWLSFTKKHKTVKVSPVTKVPWEEAI